MRVRGVHASNRTSSVAQRVEATHGPRELPATTSVTKDPARTEKPRARWSGVGGPVADRPTLCDALSRHLSGTTAMPPARARVRSTASSDETGEGARAPGASSHPVRGTVVR